MNPFAQGNLAVAARRIDNALGMLEEHSATENPVVLGTAYAELLRARGAIHAALQVEQLESDIANAPTTERPVALAVVR